MVLKQVIANTLKCWQLFLFFYIFVFLWFFLVFYFILGCPSLQENIILREAALFTLGSTLSNRKSLSLNVASNQPFWHGIFWSQFKIIEPPANVNKLWEKQICFGYINRHIAGVAIWIESPCPRGIWVSFT